MSIRTYESLVADTQIDTVTTKAETETESGDIPMDTKEALNRLRRKYAK